MGKDEGLGFWRNAPLPNPPHEGEGIWWDA